MSEPNDAIPSSGDPGYYQEPNPGNGYPVQQGSYPTVQYPQQYQPPYGQPYGQQQYVQQYQQPYGQPYGQPYAQPYPPMMVAPKSPGVAVLASFFIPGLGSMISGRGGMGALILGLYVFSWFLTIVLIGFIGVFGCWIWGMIQGHADAVAWNRSHGIIS
jgi:TM2 domain-containing membrane protein YozV